MKHRNRHPLQAMALVSIILSQLAGSVLIGLFSGRWADQWLDTEPLFLILGLLSGLAAGVFMMLRTVHHFFQEINNSCRICSTFFQDFVHTYCIC